MLGLGFGLCRREKPVAAAGGGAAVELWPQVDFNATTGLTLNGWSHAAGAVTSSNTTRCEATALATLTAGTYHVLLELTANDPEDATRIWIGNAAAFAAGDVNDGVLASGVFEEDFVVPSVANQLIGFSSPSGAGQTVTRFSVTKVA